MSYAPESKPRKRKRGKRVARLLWLALFASLGLNWWLWRGGEVSVPGGSAGPSEKFVEGDRDAAEKIARVEIAGTIMPPLTERVIEEIEAAREDDAVKGVLLVVDSPGGLVADSHRIWHELRKLSEAKSIAVAFGRLAASGGYYVAMGAGPEAKIFAEPTTWTGSIGVIIPRYDLTGLGEKFGVASDSLKTGPYKDALNPLAPLTDDERGVWEAILEDAFGKFVDVIATGREGLDEAAVRELATGQIYTADQALAGGLVDEIGYDEDALASLKEGLGLSEAQVIEYTHPTDWSELLGVLGRASTPADGPWGDALGRLTATPRAYYLFGASSLSAAESRLAAEASSEAIGSMTK